MMGMAFTWVLFASSMAFAEPFGETVQQESAQIRLQHPSIAARVDGMMPSKNRAGMPFFPGPDLVDDRAQVLIQDRLLFGADELSVRVALGQALDGDHRLPWAVIKTLPDSLRAALINGYKQHGDDDAVEAFEGALMDRSPMVRAEAMRLVGYRPELQSPRIQSAMREGLSDQDAETRRFTIRSIAWRSESWGFDAITPLLSDADPAVRGAAVRALGRLDRSRAQTLPEIRELQSDIDPKVTRPLRSLLKP